MVAVELRGRHDRRASVEAVEPHLLSPIKSYAGLPEGHAFGEKLVLGSTSREPRVNEESRITYGFPEPFAERVEELKGRSSFFLVWPDGIEIINRGKSGEIFCQKHPVKNRRDPFSPKAFCHKRSTRSTNGSTTYTTVQFFRTGSPLRFILGCSTVCAIRRDTKSDPRRMKSRLRGIVAVARLADPYCVWIR